MTNSESESHADLPKVAGFKLNRLLGVGATAEVFAATNENKMREVALKVFSPTVSRDTELIERLEEECRILERLRHPNVVATYGVQRRTGQFALELELVDGVDLRQWISLQQKNLALVEPGIWVLAQVARGLGAAHEIGALHRDLKPENVLVAKSGDVKITDFGLARTVTRVTMTRVGLLVGSLGYLAPEVINGERASNQSDIFSLGVIAYEMLSGRPPFIGETPQSLIQNMTLGRFVSLGEIAPHLPLPVSKVIDRCLSRDPKERPASVWEFEATMMTALQNSQILRLAKLLVIESFGSENHSACNSASVEAMRIKHAQLLADSPEGNRAQILAEFHRLFPSDSKLTELIEARTQAHHSRSTRWRGPAAAIAILIFLLIGLYRFSQEEAAAPPQAPPLQTAVTASPAIDAVEKLQTKPKVITQIENKPKAEAQEKGVLSFEVPEDVKIYVDEKQVPPLELKSYKMAPGRYSMRIEKEGYLPIQSNVEVRAGRVAVIRAGGFQ